jgi:hypothetical protein
MKSKHLDSPEFAVSTAVPGFGVCPTFPSSTFGRRVLHCHTQRQIQAVMLN